MTAIDALMIISAPLWIVLVAILNAWPLILGAWVSNKLDTGWPFVIGLVLNCQWLALITILTKTKS